MNAQKQQHDEAGEKLELIYKKVYDLNEIIRRNGRKDLMLSVDDLALTRWAFNLKEKK